MVRCKYAIAHGSFSPEPIRAHYRNATQRQAISVLELLVVLSVIGLVLALILPAVQSTRETSRLVSCKNNVRQLVIASQNLEASHNVLPSGGWGKLWTGLPGAAVSRKQPGGWPYQLLPHLERSVLHNQGGPTPRDADANTMRLGVPISTFYCPERRKPRTLLNAQKWKPFLCNTPLKVARNDYAMNAGDEFFEYEKGPTSLEEGRIFRWRVSGSGLVRQALSYRLADATDGLSNVYLFGEKHLPVEHYRSGVDWGDNEACYSGDDRDLVRWTGVIKGVGLRPLSDNQAFEASISESGMRFGGAHRNSFTVAMCDGSVESKAFTIDATTHMQLGNRADGSSR